MSQTAIKIVRAPTSAFEAACNAILADGYHLVAAFESGDQIVAVLALGTVEATFEALSDALAAVGVRVTALELVNTIADFAANGAISITDGVKKLSKATAGAYTLAAPGAIKDVEIEIFNATDAAHVVTVTGGLFDGVTNGTTITFAAKKGATVRLRGLNGGAWYVMGGHHYTVA